MEKIVLVINFVAIILVFLLQAKLPPVVPLLYGLPKGEEQLVPRLFLLAPLAMAQIIVAINFAITKITHDKFSRKVLTYLMVATSILSIITVAKIMFLVGNV